MTRRKRPQTPEPPSEPSANWNVALLAIAFGFFLIGYLEPNTREYQVLDPARLGIEAVAAAAIVYLPLRLLGIWQLWGRSAVSVRSAIFFAGLCFALTEPLRIANMRFDKSLPQRHHRAVRSEETHVGSSRSGRRSWSETYLHVASWREGEDELALRVPGALRSSSRPYRPYKRLTDEELRALKEIPTTTTRQHGGTTRGTTRRPDVIVETSAGALGLEWVRAIDEVAPGT
jgi:hypothetical protein